MKKINTLILFLFIPFILYSQTDTSTINATIIENQDLSKIDSIAKVLNLKGGDKVKVFAFFTVTEDGEIINIKARGPHPVFEQEAVRIIKLIPKLNPPKLNGKPASPKFSLPIVFVIETDRQKQRRRKRERKKLKNKNN